MEALESSILAVRVGGQDRVPIPLQNRVYVVIALVGSKHICGIANT